MEIDIDTAYGKWEATRGKIEMSVINKAWNEDAMSGIPHMDFLDLVLYCRVIIDKNENGVAVRLSKTICSKSGESAKKNCGRQLFLIWRQKNLT